MGCLKCGRDVQEGQLFCASCLEVMQKYPVKANTAVQLPHRDEVPGGKKSSARRRQAPTAEEKLQTAKRFLRRILVLWLITLGLLIASLYPAVRFLLGDSIKLTGQNYSTVSTVPTGDAPATEHTSPTTTP